MKQKLDQCKTGNDIVKYATKNGGSLNRVTGSHHIISTPKGSVPVPVHGNNEIGKGLRHQILKQLALIGITVLIIGLVVAAL